MSLVYSVQASAADPSVTARTLTIVGSSTPNAPATGPLASGVTCEVGDNISLTLVDTDPTGDSPASEPFTFVGAAPVPPPPPPSVPVQPTITGVTYVSGP